LRARHWFYSGSQPNQIKYIPHPTPYTLPSPAVLHWIEKGYIFLGNSSKLYFVNGNLTYQKK
jgi:hypothetical protein